MTCRMHRGKEMPTDFSLGKPLETRALWRVVEDRKLVGSIKTSISGYHFSKL